MLLNTVKYPSYHVIVYLKHSVVITCNFFDFIETLFKSRNNHNLTYPYFFVWVLKDAAFMIMLNTIIKGYFRIFDKTTKICNIILKTEQRSIIAAQGADLLLYWVQSWRHQLPKASQKIYGYVDLFVIVPWLV